MGLLDWCKRIKGPKYAGSGLHTVESIVPKYAPSSDANRSAAYIQAIRDQVAQYQVTPQARRWEETIIATPSLRIRQGVKTSYPDAGSIPFGEKILVDGEKEEGEGTWLHLADQRGFIKKEYTTRG
jgi:hypothetical protein